MVEREKVIKGLQCCNERNIAEVCNCPYQPSHKSDMCLFELHADALALLKAQEPIKPTRYQEGRWFKTWRCGACGGTLVFRNGEDKPNYCTDCGRPVKWE